MLTVKTVQPLVFAGSGFVPRERVRVSTDGVAKRTGAGLAGRFVVRFPGVDFCNGGAIVASGSRGSRAELSFAQFSDVPCS
jgi:hypothetical protein